jgi:hypothetical protein
MCAMLKYAGIESYYTLAFSGSRVPRFEEDFPNQAFNHVIVTVPLPGDTLYLECTSKNFPAGYYGTGNQGRRALVTKSSGSHLVDVPAMTPAQTERVYNFRVECHDDRSSTVGLDAKLRGGEFERFLSLSSGWNRNDAELYLRNYALGGGLQLTGHRIDRPHRDSTFVDVHMEAAGQGMYRVFGKVMILDNFRLSVPAYELPESRKTGVRIDIPQNDLLVVEYRFDGPQPAVAPDDVSIESPYGRYSAVFEIPGEGRLTVTKRLEINPGNIPVGEYAEFYEFVSRVRKYEHLNYQVTVL